MTDAQKEYILPTWEEVHDKFKTGLSLNPLELFIINHEPSGKSDDQFRDDLTNLITFILKREQPHG